MGISGHIAIWLNALGHDAVHLNDEGLFNLTDNLILEKAIAENRIVLTADMDFGHLLAFSHVASATVIQFRVSNFRSDAMILKIQVLLDSFQDQLNSGSCIITVEDKRFRVRKLPI